MSKTIPNAVKTFALMIVAFAMFACVGSAQTASSEATTAVTTVQVQATVQEPARATTPEKAPRRQIKRVPAPPARVTVIPSQAQVAPQVVTIVHRLSGIKILRLLLRQAGENGML